MRFRIKNFQIIDEEIIYQANPFTKSPNHWGSRIEFDNDGYLYFSIGDRFNRDEKPQNIEIDGGKIYRIHEDGKIPNDNPFVENLNSKKAIFSYGHRNPQGMVKHPNTGEIWIHEHGPKGGDEINLNFNGELRPKQDEIINKYTNYINNKQKSGLLDLYTGMRKTVMALKIEGVILIFTFEFQGRRS
mgnify:CR=1 FL=1